MVNTVIVKSGPGIAFSNPARDDPKRHKTISRPGNSAVIGQVTGKNDAKITLQVWFGYAHNSNVVDGRTYTNGKGVTKKVKDIELFLITMEGERAFAFNSAIFGGREHVVPVTEAGGIVFSTKHSIVTEEGQPGGSSISDFQLFCCVLTSCAYQATCCQAVSWLKQRTRSRLARFIPTSSAVPGTLTR